MFATIQTNVPYIGLFWQLEIFADFTKFKNSYSGYFKFGGNVITEPNLKSQLELPSSFKPEYNFIIVLSVPFYTAYFPVPNHSSANILDTFL